MAAAVPHCLAALLGSCSPAPSQKAFAAPAAPARCAQQRHFIVTRAEQGREGGSGSGDDLPPAAAAADPQPFVEGPIELTAQELPLVGYACTQYNE